MQIFTYHVSLKAKYFVCRETGNSDAKTATFNGLDDVVYRVAYHQNA